MTIAEVPPPTEQPVADAKVRDALILTSIDQALGDFSAASLLDAATVCDTLLDIRQLVSAGSPSLSSSANSTE